MAKMNKIKPSTKRGPSARLTKAQKKQISHQLKQKALSGDTDAAMVLATMELSVVNERLHNAILDNGYAAV